jgi:hypothetical protein
MARASLMKTIWTKGPKGRNKFTLVEPPFPDVGEKINGIGVVTRVVTTSGFVLTRPARALKNRNLSQSKEAK